MTGETDEFPLSRVWGRFSGCGDTPTAGSQDSSLLEGGQLRPRALGPAPWFGEKGHSRGVVGDRRISDRLDQGAKERECAHSEEVVGSWLYDCLPFLLYSGSYPPNQGGRYRAMITPKVTVELP